MFYADMWADQPQGNCAKGKPGEHDATLFEDRIPSPRYGEGREALGNYLRAVELCAFCPLKAACLEEGMRAENLQYGVFGGLLAGERQLLLNPAAVGRAVDAARAFTRNRDGWEVTDAA